jgi:hypothetical protein
VKNVLALRVSEKKEHNNNNERQQSQLKSYSATDESQSEKR